MKTEDFKDLIRPIVYKYGSGWLLDNPEMLEEICKKYHSEQLLIQRVMPRSLTAENGAKDLLRGEFVECFDPDDSGNPYIVPISWGSIKKIYKRIVDHYVA